MIKTLFMGRKTVARECLSWLLKDNRFDIKGILTDNDLSTSPVASLAYKENIPIYSYDKALELASKGEFEFGISVLYWRKLKGPLIFKNTKYGCINFHPAILPDYKGFGGYNIAILEQLKKWGSSCHYVDETIDTGPIINVDLFSIDPLIETAKSLESKTLKVMESQFIRIIKNIRKIDGKLMSYPNIGGKYISRKEMELMKEITDADDPEIKSRAFFFPPYLGAYVKIKEKKMTVITQTILKELAKND